MSSHMADYNWMARMEQHLGGNAAPSNLLNHKLRDLWKSPRGAMIRIEAFSLVAIFLCFIVVAFGSCRRWCNHWIVQKGFLAAQVLSLSLGTYSIGLMQSSPVKSEMYPIWVVSLLTLFGCIDPVTTNIGHDFKGPLLKMIFQLCLYYGYVLLISFSTMSSGIVKVAICMLSSITLIKGFHRSLAFMHQRLTRNCIGRISFYPEPADLASGGERLKVHLSGYLREKTSNQQHFGVTSTANMADIRKLQFKELTTNGLTIEEVCLGYSLSHLLQRRFLGFTTSMEMQRKREEFQKLLTTTSNTTITTIDYRRTLKVIEVELAFLYEVYFTSNQFLHSDQAKNATFWALVSLIGICFLGVVVGAIPAWVAIASIRQSNTSSAATTAHAGGAGTTLLILGSLALLQLVQLIRCWTSNLAIVSYACKVARKGNSSRSSWMMVLREFLVTRMNWSDKYLWQDKLGQYSLVDAVSVGRWSRKSQLEGCLFKLEYHGWLGKLGVINYITLALCQLLGSDTTNTEAGLRLHEDEDVKTSIAEFLGQIRSKRIGLEWSSLFVDNGLTDLLQDLPYSTTALSPPVWRLSDDNSTMASDAYAFTWRVMVWHIVTCYCEQMEQEQADGHGGRDNDKNRRVAIALSKYCAYLVVSAPELLPGPVVETKIGFMEARGWTKIAMQRGRNIMEGICRSQEFLMSKTDKDDDGIIMYSKVMDLWKQLQLNKMTTPDSQLQGEGEVNSNTGPHSSTDHWEVLARLWVRTLLYAAPYGDVQAHMQHLSQGGEFITHLWALLYHLGIDSWEREEAPHQPEAPAAESCREAEIKTGRRWKRRRVGDDMRAVACIKHARQEDSCTPHYSFLL